MKSSKICCFTTEYILIDSWFESVKNLCNPYSIMGLYPHKMAKQKAICDKQVWRTWSLPFHRILEWLGNCFNNENLYFTQIIHLLRLQNSNKIVFTSKNIARNYRTCIHEKTQGGFLLSRPTKNPDVLFPSQERTGFCHGWG